MNEEICVFSTYLPLDEENCKIWNKLAEELKSENIQMVLLSTTNCEALEVPNINIPYLLEHYIHEMSARGSIAYQPPANYIEADIAWSRDVCLTGPSTEGARLCFQFYQSIITILKPIAVFAWNGMLPQSKIFLDTARQNGVPGYSFERGLLPDTFLIDSFENCAISDLNLNFALLNAYHASQLDQNRYTEIKDYYTKKKIEKYDSKPYLSPEEFKRSIGAQGKKLIVMFGQTEPASLVPRDSNASRYASPPYANNFEAFADIARYVAADENCFMVFQDNPLNSLSYDALVHDRVCITRGENIHTLIDAAEVVVNVGGTSIQFESVFYDKPVVLLGRSQISHKSAFYEHLQGDIAVTMDAALKRDNFDQKLNHMRHFIQWICDHYLIACDDEAPMRKNLTDFSAFISTLASGAEVSVQDRFERLIIKLGLAENTEQA